MRFRKTFACVGLLVLCGCGTPEVPPEIVHAFQWVRFQVLTVWSVVSGDAAPLPIGSPTVLPLVSPSPSEYTSFAARNAKANGELFREMYQVVYNRNPKDRYEFGNWVDTLNQGASLEGVHNGLTHSEEYRELERSTGAAAADALRVFAEELAVLEVELPVPTLFDPQTAEPLPHSMQPEVQPTPDPARIDAPRPSPKVDPQIQINQLKELYLKQFVGFSVFTLKRIIADEAIRVLNSNAEFKEKNALWYSKWVLRINQRNVDFGVALRNKSDEAFHYKFAVESTDDRFKWEVLNRLHRVLNDANKQKQ